MTKKIPFPSITRAQKNSTFFEDFEVNQLAVGDGCGWELPASLPNNELVPKE